MAGILEPAAQDVQPEGVRGADGERLGLIAAEQVGGAGFHRARRLVAAGQRRDVPRREAVVADEPGELVGDDGGFAAARPGQHQEWAIDIMYCRFLMRI